MSFDIYADIPRNGILTVEKNGTPYTSYSGVRDFQITTDKTTQKFVFKMSESSVKDARIVFELGSGAQTQVFIDNVVLQEIELGKYALNETFRTGTSQWTVENSNAATSEMWPQNHVNDEFGGIDSESEVIFDDAFARVFISSYDDDISDMIFKYDKQLSLKWPRKYRLVFDARAEQGNRPINAQVLHNGQMLVNALVALKSEWTRYEFPLQVSDGTIMNMSAFATLQFLIGQDASWSNDVMFDNIKIVEVPDPNAAYLDDIMWHDQSPINTIPQDQGKFFIVN